MGIRTVIGQGVRKVMKNQLILNIGSESMAFDTADDLTAFLKRNAQISADTLSKLKDLPVEKLEKEAAKTARLYKLVLSQLLQVAEERMSLDMLWRDLDIDILPDEQQWPAILFAVSSHEQLDDDGRREAVERYVEYLRQRRGLIEKLIGLQTGENLDHQDTAEIEADIDAGIFGDKEELLGEDVTAAAMTRSKDYRRLPANKSMSFILEDGGEIPLYLARWKVVIHRTGDGLVLEEDGSRAPFSHGRNTIGRSSTNTIALTGSPLDVSREHLIVDWNGDNKVTLEDVSSKGTWLPQSLLKEAMTAA